MQKKNLFFWFLVMIVLTSCQSAAPTLLPTDTGKMETQIAATIYANQTSTAMNEQDPEATLTATVPPLAETPEAALTPKPQAFHFSLPASACWINSEINVHEGQTVLIRAAGEVNTWGGRAGSSSKPVGQKGICGALQCPLQGVGYGALIARVEDLPPFFVGNMLRFTPPKDGQLYFTVNDWQCEDNSGTFEIMVTFP